MDYDLNEELFIGNDETQLKIRTEKEMSTIELYGGWLSPATAAEEKRHSKVYAGEKVSTKRRKTDKMMAARFSCHPFETERINLGVNWETVFIVIGPGTNELSVLSWARENVDEYLVFNFPSIALWDTAEFCWLIEKYLTGKHVVIVAEPAHHWNPAYAEQAHAMAAAIVEDVASLGGKSEVYVVAPNYVTNEFGEVLDETSLCIGMGGTPPWMFENSEGDTLQELLRDPEAWRSDPDAWFPYDGNI